VFIKQPEREGGVCEKFLEEVDELLDVVFESGEAI